MIDGINNFTCIIFDLKINHEAKKISGKRLNTK